MNKNPHFEAVAQGCGYEKGDITKTLGSLIAKTANELKEVGASPEEILRRCEVYRANFPGFILTPTALAKHWAGLKPQAESEWDYCCRVAKERGLAAFKGHPYETQKQFIERVKNSVSLGNVVNLR